MNQPRSSEKAMDCFIHGLAHLIDEMGVERGLAIATQVVLGLTEEDSRRLADIVFASPSPVVGGR